MLMSVLPFIHVCGQILNSLNSEKALKCKMFCSHLFISHTQIFRKNNRTHAPINMNNILTHICVIYSIYIQSRRHTQTPHTRIYICLSPYLIHYPVEIVKDSYNYYYIMCVRCDMGRLLQITVAGLKVDFFW